MNLRGLVKGLDDLYRNRQVQLLLILQGEAAVESLIEFLLGPPSLHAEPRCLAAEALGIIGGDRAVEGLMQALTVNDVSSTGPAIQLAEETVRNWVAGQLDNLGDRRAIPALLNALRRFHLTNAATALARFGVVEAIPEIVSGLEDDFIRDRLIVALRMFGRAAVPCLMETLFAKRHFDLDEHPTSIRRRACAARLLGEFHDSAANAALSVLLTDNAGPVRFEAALALLAQGEAGKPEQADELISLLLGGLDTEDFDATLRCRDALCAAGSVALPHLREILAAGRVQQPGGVQITLPDEARLLLIDCLVTLGDLRAAKMMSVLLEDPNAQVRLTAGWALNRLEKETPDGDAGP
jgi:HEAT repeat protein